jgi:hypothetical protein
LEVLKGNFICFSTSLLLQSLYNSNEQPPTTRVGLGGEVAWERKHSGVSCSVDSDDGGLLAETHGWEKEGGAWYVRQRNAERSQGIERRYVYLIFISLPTLPQLKN